MRKFILAVGLVLMASSAQAATLIVVEGQLIGASGVDVGGTQYDVAFGDGSCVSLFNGCDEDSDFAFQSSADGLLAAQALADQVFDSDSLLGSFDSDPGLTRGCLHSPEFDYCTILIPHAPAQGVDPDPPAGFISVTGYRNLPAGGVLTEPGFLSISAVTLDSTFSTKALFTLSVVPEPPAVPGLLPAGLGVLLTLLLAAGARQSPERARSGQVVRNA